MNGESPADPLTEDPRSDGLRRAESLVLLNTGDGKGKSSAAFGVVMRSVARDWPVAVVQFIKSGNWHTGEEKVARHLGVDWWSLGEGFTWDSDNLDKDRATAVEAWRHARSLLETASHRLVVFDEVTYPVNWGWLDVEDVATAIRDRSSKVNVVLTGRNAPDQLIAVADTVTEMHNVKHAYETGLRALKGIDY
ncbi:MAG: cob(I)yrinic acid a,c-diamide adenosyltransferase [Acidimicrobiaceae bacterium]|nr:cob(I)yrinic acid a,c-diamide adenosyltransferase [Acidimicrobiaceae bacterium]|tara:strand:- start:1060 stop:1638 length:579 start_codon:yes stop_codon:yes gene_type:complete